MVDELEKAISAELENMEAQLSLYEPDAHFLRSVYGRLFVLEKTLKKALLSVKLTRSAVGANLKKKLRG